VYVKSTLAGSMILFRDGRPTKKTGGRLILAGIEARH
jgi:hypothetical protein